MQVISTPHGFRPAADMQVGDVVLSADSRTGRRLLNAIESVQRVTSEEWERWHQTVRCPDFVSLRINDDFTLFSEQSIVHNDGAVTHAKHLRVGNVIVFRGQPVKVKRIKKVDAKPWYRFDIGGDHSYIGEGGLALHNASRFWVGGTGTWDLSATTHWAASTGGASGSSAPGSADAVTIDGSSGAGTVTPSFGGTGTFQSLTCGAMGMSLDFSANNNSITLKTTTGFVQGGSGT